ncbi:MAG: hypothetical protein WA659_01040 [Candidatus Aquirickettsiella sp.]
MKKTDVKNIAGGKKTTVTKPDASKTITYDGVNNLHIGRTFTYGVPSSTHAATTSNHNTWKQQSPSSTNFSSTVKTGITFKKVDSLHLNSKEINKMSSNSHKNYANSKDYRDSQANSSDTSSFKR